MGIKLTNYMAYSNLLILPKTRYFYTILFAPKGD